MSEEEMFFNFLKEYRDEPNAPDYSGEYPQPYELTKEDAELILNVIETKDKEIERLNNIINELKQKLNLAENILYDYLYKDKKITKELYNEFKELKGDGSNE